MSGRARLLPLCHYVPAGPEGAHLVRQTPRGCMARLSPRGHLAVTKRLMRGGRAGGSGHLTHLRLGHLAQKTRMGTRTGLSVWRVGA